MRWPDSVLGDAATELGWLLHTVASRCLDGLLRQLEARLFAIGGAAILCTA